MTYNEEIVAKDLIKEIRELRKTYEKSEEIKQSSIARVDIPLDEYNKLINEIAVLKRSNEALKERNDAIGLLLSKLDIPFEELDIEPKSIWCEKSENMITCKTSYLIKFTADQVRR